MGPGELLRAIAKLRGKPITYVERVQRELRRRSLITASGRGVSSQDMTYLDASTSVVASYIPGQITQVGAVVDKLLNVSNFIEPPDNDNIFGKSLTVAEGPLMLLAQLMKQYGSSNPQDFTQQLPSTLDNLQRNDLHVLIHYDESLSRIGVEIHVRRDTAGASFYFGDSNLWIFRQNEEDNFAKFNVEASVLTIRLNIEPILNLARLMKGAEVY